jgi:drug/metabolite transporter (DMT)-like permease
MSAPPAARRASPGPSAAGPPAAGPWTAFTFCCLIWGSTFLFIGIGNDTLDPVWAVVLRLALATALLATITVLLRRPWPRGAERRAALWFGFVDFGVSLPLLTWGQREVPSGLAAVIFATLPLTTALFARAFGLERLRRAQIMASLVAVGGVAMLSSGRGGPVAGAAAFLAVFVSAVTSALAGVLLKRAPDSDPFAMNAIAHAVGLPFCIAASLLLGERWTMPAGSGLASVVYLATLGSVGAFVAFAWLMRHWTVSRTAYITVIVPVIAMGLGAAVRGEGLPPMTLAGAALVLGAVTWGIASEGRAGRETPAVEPGGRGA